MKQQNAVIHLNQDKCGGASRFRAEPFLVCYHHRLSDRRSAMGHDVRRQRGIVYEEKRESRAEVEDIEG